MTFTATRVAGLDSSAISKVAYNDDSQQLLVEFVSGGDYIYSDVPPTEYDSLIEYDTTDYLSAGNYYRQNIAGTFPSVRVDPITVVMAQPKVAEARDALAEWERELRAAADIKVDINTTDVVSVPAFEALTGRTVGTTVNYTLDGVAKERTFPGDTDLENISYVIDDFRETLEGFGLEFKLLSVVAVFDE